MGQFPATHCGTPAHGTGSTRERTTPPPGRATVTAARGPQYATASADVDLRDGAPATVELKLRRAIDLQQGDDIDEEAFKALVRSAAELN